MAAKAHEISLEAGSKMAAAMKDVVGAAAGLTGLVVESARDLLQYMVRRGQMTQDEADKLMREVESSHGLKRKAPTPLPVPGAKSAPKAVEVAAAVAVAPRPAAAPVKAAAPTRAAAKRAPIKKPAARKTTMKPAAKKRSHKSAKKSKGKASAKSGKRR